MGFRVVPTKRGFRVLLETYREGVRDVRTVPRDAWAQHGFYEAMTVDEARARMRALNADAHELRHHERRESIRQRLDNEARALELSVPLAEEYRRTLTTKKHRAYFSVCLRLLTELRVSPEDYHVRKEDVWRWFLGKEFSVDYVQKLTRTLNAYGTFWAWRYKRFFIALPYPKGHWREKIADKNSEAGGRGNKASAALTPELLESKRSVLRPEHYNYLYLTVWFGLRPNEADALKISKMFRLEKMHGVTVLAVYQSKLTSVPRDQRWKFIPAFRREQAEGLDIIAGGNFRRPLAKTINCVFGHEYSLYAGRKGFTDLMLSFGQSLEDVSQWMGHASIERTWRSYKNKKVVRWK